MKKLILIGILLSLLVGCMQQFVCSDGTVVASADLCTKEEAVETTPEETKPEEIESEECPVCDDNNDCTEDICNEGTNYECTYKVITPCCGNNDCEDTEDNDICPEDCAKDVMSEELQKMIAGQGKIKSYEYAQFDNKDIKKAYVKGDKLRYDLSKAKKKEYLNQYDAVFLDKTEKKAYLVCTDIVCENRNIADNASYEEYFMETPLEIIEGVTYKGNILATELCDVSKPCNKVEVVFPDEKTGYLWIDNYYGFPYNIEKNGKMYEFNTVAINSVTDEEINLP